MSAGTEFDLARVAASMVVIVSMLIVAVQVLPSVAAALVELATPMLILWFIAITLRGMVQQLLS
jgi:hypothetical protein